MTKKEREFHEALEAIDDPKKAFIRSIKKDVKELVKAYTKEMEEAKTPQEKAEVDKRWEELKNKCALKITWASVFFDKN